MASLCFPVLYSNWRLLFFAPFLIIVYYKKPYLTSLWISCFCGLFLDVFSSHIHIGLYAMNYTITTCLLYHQRKHFFSDSISTLPLMTFFFAVLSTSIQWGLMYTLEQKTVFTWGWVQTDLIYMPILDAIYSFIVFVAPSFLFFRKSNRKKEYFSSKRAPLYQRYQ